MVQLKDRRNEYTNNKKREQMANGTTERQKKNTHKTI